MRRAQRNKSDEFWTRLEDVEAELAHYPGAFRGTTVYLNCDDPSSAFWKYFADRFAALGLKELVSTKYPEGLLFRLKTAGGTVEVVELEGDGDFRSPECVELLERSDIVVTNPPLSLFREYIGQLMEYGKGFLVLGNVNAITYKEIWPLIQSEQLWLGPSIHSGDRPFMVPDSYPLEGAGCWSDEAGQRWIRVKGVRWFTNLDHGARHRPLALSRTYSPEDFPKYSNYDAIEVSKVKDIPGDYDGVMGVPITFLDKWNPDQFEIIGDSARLAQPMSASVPPGDTYVKGGPRLYVPVGSGHHQRKYARILIRRRRPQG